VGGPHGDRSCRTATQRLKTPSGRSPPSSPRPICACFSANPELTSRRQRALMSVLVNAMRTETEIREEIEALRNLTTAQLKAKYREVFGEDTRSNHKQFLFRRIAWRIQASALGWSLRTRPPPRAGDCQRRRSSHSCDQELPARACRERQHSGSACETVARSPPAVARHAAHPTLPGQGHHRPRSAGWRVVVQRQDLQVAEPRGDRGDGHALERLRLLRFGTPAREGTWRTAITATASRSRLHVAACPPAQSIATAWHRGKGSC